eukprot:GHVU01169494.1.p1 GENE.GHVU01169494.1~~GHVU01169494.1.p1  ORF type:complete len:132 (-),score=9.99 GHVU01169494.1:296-691(-)
MLRDQTGTIGWAHIAGAVSDAEGHRLRVEGGLESVEEPERMSSKVKTILAWWLAKDMSLQTAREGWMKSHDDNLTEAVMNLLILREVVAMLRPCAGFGTCCRGTCCRMAAPRSPATRLKGRADSVVGGWDC